MKEKETSRYQSQLMPSRISHAAGSAGRRCYCPECSTNCGQPLVVLPPFDLCPIVDATDRSGPDGRTIGIHNIAADRADYFRPIAHPVSVSSNIHSLPVVVV